MIPVTVENSQRKFKIVSAPLKKLAWALIEKANVPLKDVTLIIVDDEGCAPINEAAVGHHGATDVITITYPAIPGEDPGDSAEIILNAECAWKQGGGTKPGADKELSFYLAHAFDHLAGHDDNTPAARTSMHRREWRWLKAITPALDCYR